MDNPPPGMDEVVAISKVCRFSQFLFHWHSDKDHVWY